MKKCILYLMASIFFSGQGFGYEAPVGSKIDFSYPVNHLDDLNQVTAFVEVPATYRALGPIDAPFVEFIPQTDSDPNQWTELWTAVVSVGRAVRAPEMMDETIAGIQNHPGTELKVLSREEEDKGRYHQSTAYIQYKDPSSKTGNTVAEYIVLAGPMDAVMLQRARAYKDTKEVEDIVETFKKNKHVTIIEGR